MGRNCCVISKQYVPDANLAYIWPGSESGEVLSVVVYRRHVVATGQRKSQRAFEQLRSLNLFDAAADFEWIRGAAVELHTAPFVSA